MDIDAATKILDKALARIEALRSNPKPNSAEHVAFVQSTGLDLARVFGRDSAVTRNFSAIDYRFVGQFFGHALNYEQELARRSMGAYLQGLEYAKGIIQSGKEQLEEHGADKILRQAQTKAEGARVFISHGSETPALARIERFLRALGVTPVIVVREASKGMAVDDLVEQQLGSCDCAIILATADEAIGERKQPRPNVLHEIGLAQEKLENRIIYLKEEGCSFPSNVGPKVWENFTQGNLEAAFEKIGKELRAFDLL